VTARWETIDDYISSFPEDVQAVLGEVRRAIRDAVPGAGETIKYQMPTITLDGRSVVHFAAWKHHIGLYPLPAVDGPLEQQIAPYDTGRGTARFRLDEPVPYDLIGRLAAMLVEHRDDADT